MKTIKRKCDNCGKLVSALIKFTVDDLGEDHDYCFECYERFHFPTKLGEFVQENEYVVGRVTSTVGDLLHAIEDIDPYEMSPSKVFKHLEYLRIEMEQVVDEWSRHFAKNQEKN